MDKKEIQEQRIRGYFIEAAKEILKGEGLKCINVRNVSERAGYSYGTLYNYFKDIKELVFICVQDFQKECREIIETETKKIKPGKEIIFLKVKSFIKYFIQYPGIFELFYLERINDIGSQQTTSELIYSFLENVCMEDWQFCKENEIFTEAEIEIKQNQIRYIVVGLLLFYLNRRIPVKYNEFNKIVERQLSYILKINN